MENIELAKNLYFKAGCSHFFMTRNDTINEYKRFGIPKEYEDQWDEEYLKNKYTGFNRCTGMDMIYSANDIVSIVSKHHDGEQLYQFGLKCLDRMDRCDHLALLIIVEMIRDAIKNCYFPLHKACELLDIMLRILLMLQKASETHEGEDCGRYARRICEDINTIKVLKRKERGRTHP